MASFQLHTDPLVSCPYNPAHRLKKSRMQIHLTKCKKQYGTLELKECPFNAQHRIQPSEFQYHITCCPDRRMVEREIVHASENSHQGNTSVPSYHVEETHVSEYWDETPSTQPGYDPKKRLETGNFILIPKGQPVDRRNSYKKMFQTASEKNEQNGIPSENLNTINVPITTSPDTKPMRVPKATPQIIEMASNLGRGQAPLVRRKIAANIFGGTMGTNQSVTPNLPGGQPGMAVGLGRGVGRGRQDGVGTHPPLAPGKVQYLTEETED